jgi:hypothetical protein
VLAIWLVLHLFIFEGEALGWRQEIATAQRLNGTPRDFLAFYTGALIVQRGQGHALYDLELQASTQESLMSEPAIARLQQQVRVRVLPFLNPPFVALLFVPLTRLALPQAYALWLIICLGMLVSLVAVLTISMSAWPVRERLFAAAAGLTFLPAYFAVWQGQISLLLALVAVVAWTAFRASKEQWGGFVLAALFAKPQYALLIAVVLIWERRWRAVVGFGVGTAMLALVSLFLVGAEGLFGWLTLLARLPSLGSEYGHHAELQFTWSGLVSAATGAGFVLNGAPSWPFLLWLALEVSTLLALATASRPPRLGLEAVVGLRYGVLLTSALLLSVHTNIQDLAMLTVVGYLIWDAARDNAIKRSIALVLLVCGHLQFFALFMLRTAIPVIPYPNLFVVPVLGLWVLILRCQ